ncbi:unnamed protein product [Linum tenue]|jgi:hypothetical protein
MAIR